MNIVLYSIVPVAASFAAATIAVVFKLGDRLRSIVQRLAAGVVVAAVAIEVIPDLISGTPRFRRGSVSPWRSLL